MRFAHIVMAPLPYSYVAEVLITAPSLIELVSYCLRPVLQAPHYWGLQSIMLKLQHLRGWHNARSEVSLAI
jgi:hypothetical protein